MREVNKLSPQERIRREELRRSVQFTGQQSTGSTFPMQEVAGMLDTVTGTCSAPSSSSDNSSDSGSCE